VRFWDVESGMLQRTMSCGNFAPNELIFTPDGKTLITSEPGNRSNRNFSGGVHLWDRATGRHLRELRTPGQGAGALTLSRNSRWLATSSGGRVHVWDFHTGNEIGADEGHQGYVARIAVSPTGVIATAGDDHTVRVWDPASGLQRLLLRHGYWVRALAVSPDARQIATSSLDDTVRVWELSTGAEIYRLAGHGKQGGRRALRFTPDGQRLLSFGDDFLLRIWDLRTGKALAEHAIRPSGVKLPDENSEPWEHERFLLGGESTFSHDGKILLWDVTTGFFIFDVDSGKELAKIARDGASGLAVTISPDGTQLLWTGHGKGIEMKLPDGKIRFSQGAEICRRELLSGKVLQQIAIEGTAWPVAFSPDGKLFASGIDKPASHVRLWDARTGEEVRRIDDLPARASCLAFSPDGKLLIAGLEDTTALIWDIRGIGSK